MIFEIRKTQLLDKATLLNLYKKVAALPQGIIRNENEITEKYIDGVLSKSIKNGLSLVGLLNGLIIAEIHAFTPDVFAFQHILSDLTIVVGSDFQGKGYGRKLFETFLNTVQAEYKHILRIELYTREHNHRNVKFYESLGFINEGGQKNKIFAGKNQFETPLHMAWFNPGYQKN